MRKGRDGFEIKPECTVCGQRKNPLGRDAGMYAATSYCHPMECDGYMLEPHPSSYWSEDEPALTADDE